MSLNLPTSISWRGTMSRILPWRKIFSLLHVSPVIGGLEISDTTLRYACWDGIRWYLTVLRLPPGLMLGGKIQDPTQFRQALGQLKNQISAIQGHHKKVGVAVSLSSVSVYSQIFTLPVIKEENLEKAIQLNIQMASPKKDSENYSGWQLVGEDQNSVHLEILSAFIEKGLVDDMIQTLKDTGFEAHSVESRAASLARAMRELGVGFDLGKSYLALNVDGSGMEFVVIRRGNIYFEYFLPWHDVYSGEKQISQEAFTSEVIRSVHQVLNFYSTHWTEPLNGFYIAATGLEETLINIIQSNFSIRVLNLELNFPQRISPAWFVVIGSGLRGMVSPRDDKEISLLGVSAQEDFRRGLLLRFMEFWRVLVPISLGILLLSFIGGDAFLRQTFKSLEEKNAYLQVGARQSKDIAELQKRVVEFNDSVDMVGAVLKNMEPRFEALKTVRLAMDETKIDLVHMNFPGYNTKVDISGEAPSESNITAFAGKLREDPRFSEVKLPPQGASRDLARGNWSFSMSFKMSPKTK
ncbi:MAG TPA: hypothetical protein VJL32_03260 [Candidatus Paceibacterota bacterium]